MCIICVWAGKSPQQRHFFPLGDISTSRFTWWLFSMAEHFQWKPSTPRLLEIGNTQSKNVIKYVKDTYDCKIIKSHHEESACLLYQVHHPRLLLRHGIGRVWVSKIDTLILATLTLDVWQKVTLQFYCWQSINLACHLVRTVSGDCGMLGTWARVFDFFQKQSGRKCVIVASALRAEQGLYTRN